MDFPRGGRVTYFREMNIVICHSLNCMVSSFGEAAFLYLCIQIYNMVTIEGYMVSKCEVI